jgi:uridine phosphorylase
MPSRLRPVASVAADAVLVGDPGRALLLAQELQESPKMSNHARGLWGYWGTTPAGRELTVQSTGMGGPSAALVLADLAELGVRRAVRVGTCAAIAPEPVPGELLVASEAHAWGGGREGEAVLPDGGLTEALRAALAETEAVGTAVVASLDFLHSQSTPAADPGARDAVYAERADAADMQTATLMLEAQARGVAFAAVLIVAESAAGEQADDELLEVAAKRAGGAAAKALETLN